MPFQAHPSTIVDEPVSIGDGTRIWHFAHICKNVSIGENCSFGQNTMVAEGVRIGSNVKVQNNVAIYAGTVIEDDVFLGPSCVLTNVSNPRAQVVRRALYESTLIRRGATVGANATIVCGTTLGRYCFIAAGAVVTASVPDYAMMLGVPARQQGWASRHGHPLKKPDKDGIYTCPESGFQYREENDCLHCLSLGEEEPLPPELSIGEKPYPQIKKERESNPPG